jgi:hypothetical protein
MWKRSRWFILVGLVLVLISVELHLAHYLVFHDAHHTLIYLAGDIAFIPLEVFLVALVIERIMSKHERDERMRQMNMPIGVFFGELGTDLLAELLPFVGDAGQLTSALNVRSGWDASAFRRAEAAARASQYAISVDPEHLTGLRTLLERHRDMLLMLMANPNLLEREQFSDLLSAIFHLMEELRCRGSFDALPESDLKHLAGDVRRVLAALTVAWLHYCRHLKSEYPYIFSVVVRTHPLQSNPDPVVR